VVFKFILLLPSHRPKPYPDLNMDFIFNVIDFLPNFVMRWTDLMRVRFLMLTDDLIFSILII